VLWDQGRNPLLLLLLFAAIASGVSGEWRDALIVSAIVLATVGIGYNREYSAKSAAAALRVRVKTRANVLRDGRAKQAPLEEIVPGDVVLLSAGSIVPADAVVLEATDCHVSEAVLTGESFPVEKEPGTSPPAASPSKRTNCVFLGTNVRSGTARCLVVTTGPSTEFGTIAHRLTLRPPDTEFDKGIRHFGYLLTSAMLIVVLLVFVAHMFRGRPPVETLLFAIALAVALSPELLPAMSGSVDVELYADAVAHRDHELALDDGDRLELLLDRVASRAQGSQVLLRHGSGLRKPGGTDEREERRKQQRLGPHGRSSRVGFARQTMPAGRSRHVGEPLVGHVVDTPTEDPLP
jgi:Mg2+-importing ATPase